MCILPVHNESLYVRDIAAHVDADDIYLYRTC